jgi:hypothetical protein
MTGTTDGTGAGSGMTREQMERDARKVIFEQGVGNARGVGNPAIERAIPQARNVLSLLEEVERIRDAATISVTIAGHARRAISSGQIHDKEVGRKVELIETTLFAALEGSSQ